MNQLSALYDAALPWISDRGRRVLHSVVDSQGRIPCAQDFAISVELVNRHQVARVLRTEGLPQIEELCAWVKTIHLIQEWERTHRSLYALAIDAKMYPPNCYRLLKRVTGKTWTHACADGSTVMMMRFAGRCAELRCAPGISEQNRSQIA